MSERERWIVYPLLFLALGSALRDKLVKQTRTKQLVCEELIVVDVDGRPQAQLKEAQLRLDFAGRERGYVVANVVQADVVRARALMKGNQQVGAGGAGMGVSWPQLLRFLQQIGLVRMNVTPVPQAVPAPMPPSPPGGGPQLAPPAIVPGGQDPVSADESPGAGA